MVFFLVPSREVQLKTDLLRVVGSALYGQRWQVEIARDLGVTYRTLARWLALDAMPDDVPFRLRPIVKTRVDRVLEVRKLLWSSLGEDLH